MPIVIDGKRTAAEFAMFATEMAQLNPNGFRAPGKSGTSLPERAAIAAGMMSNERLGSGRGNEKRELRRKTNALIKISKTWHSKGVDFSAL